MAKAGATLPKRDAVDERVIKMVRTGTVTAKPDVAGLAEELHAVGYSDSVIEGITAMVSKGIISNIEQVGGYPAYEGMPYPDADGDGMPDAWETKYGLNPYHSLDASGDLNGDGYTNIEDFLNGLDPRAKSPRGKRRRVMWTSGAARIWIELTIAATGAA